MKAVWVLVYEVNGFTLFEVFTTRQAARNYRDEMRTKYFEDETFIKIQKSWLH